MQLSLHWARFYKDIKIYFNYDSFYFITVSKKGKVRKISWIIVPNISLIVEKILNIERKLKNIECRQITIACGFCGWPLYTLGECVFIPLMVWLLGQEISNYTVRLQDKSITIRDVCELIDKHVLVKIEFKSTRTAWLMEAHKTTMYENV